MTHLVVEHPGLDGARAVVHEDSLPEHELRGWVVVGPTTNPLRAVSDDEQAELDAAASAEVAARLASASEERERLLVEQSVELPPEPPSGPTKPASVGRKHKE